MPMFPWLEVLDQGVSVPLIKGDPGHSLNDTGPGGARVAGGVSTVQ